MILLLFIDIYLNNRHTDYLLNNPDDSSIKELIIIIGIVTIIYLLLHQINQNNDFNIYNKILILIMVIDIILSIFFVSKQIINNSLATMENQLELIK
jgi:hypothetical protein